MAILPHSSLVEAAQSFAIMHLQSLPSHFVYHDLTHTQEVVEAAQEIGEASALPEDSLEMVLVAAWLHDIGYTDSNTHDHETVSKQTAREFLQKEGLDEARIVQVEGLIEATRMPQTPKTLAEQVICDADLYHLSTKQFAEKSLLLRQEWEHTQPATYTEQAWLEENISFLEKHQYFTPYAQENLNEGKAKNLKKLEKRLKKLKKQEEDYLMSELGVDSTQLKKMKKKLEKAEGRPERGIETMFRVTSRNHVDFSSMADSKANILISVNSIIITIIIGVLIRKLDSNPHLIIPTFLLLTVCLSSIVFAILATRPNVTSGRFTKEDIQEKRANLLFFGNFYKMKLQDFEWGMKEMIEDADYLYGSMIRDIYFIGSVLGKKYHYLRIAYTIFMIGLVVASISFMIASMLAPESATLQNVESLF